MKRWKDMQSNGSKWYLSLKTDEKMTAQLTALCESMGAMTNVEDIGKNLDNYIEVTYNFGGKNMTQKFFLTVKE
jgi:uncharacterized phage-associated protein